MCGVRSSRFDRHSCAQPCGQTHHRGQGCGTALGECYWKTAPVITDLLVAHAATIAAAFRDAIQRRRPLDYCLTGDAGASARRASRRYGERAEQFGQLGSVADVDGDAGNLVGDQQGRAVGAADQAPPVAVGADQPGLTRACGSGPTRAAVCR